MKLPRNFNVPRLALNQTELALSLGVSPSSIEKMIAEGFLPQPRRWHSRKLWIMSEVAAHLNDWPTEPFSPPQVALNRIAKAFPDVLSEEEWKVEIVASALNKLERTALKQLLAYDEGV